MESQTIQTAEQQNKQIVIQQLDKKSLCSNCNSELITSISFNKKFLNRYFKVYSFFCGCCDYLKQIEIRISKEDYENSIKDRTIKLQNTTTTNKVYNQKFIKN